MKKKVLAACCALFIGQWGYAQQTKPNRLDSFFNALDQHHQFMGSVAVSKEGKSLYSTTIGYKNVEDKQKPDVHTKYRIGSISKTFTAVLMLQAVEEGKLKLTDPINAYFPEVKHAEKITISQLLNHHSGIPNFTNSKAYLDWYTQEKTDKEMIALISNAGSDFEPGTKAAYSNSNFVLLSYILQRIYKKPYAAILQEKIVKPLGLKDTYYGSSIAGAKNESFSYEWNQGTWAKQKETAMSIPMGAGGIVSTPSDLNLFAYALFNGKLLSAESISKMQSFTDGFGLGLSGVPFYERKGYGHGGSIDGFRSFLAYFPEGKVSVAFTSNGSVYDNNKITIALLSSAYGVPYQIPDFTVIVEDLEPYVGVYASDSFPLKITVSKSGSSLVGQATGQASFPLQGKRKGVYVFEPAGLELHFNVALKQMTLRQGGKDYVLMKQ